MCVKLNCYILCPSFVECSLTAKRKLSSAQETAATAVVPFVAKQVKNPSYFIPELAHVVNMCDERLPFIGIATELSNRNIAHSGLQIEANATSLVLQLLTLPEPGCQHTTSENKVTLFFSFFSVYWQNSLVKLFNRFYNCPVSI